MNYDPLMFRMAWSRQNEFFKKTSNFHDAMLKAIKVESYSLMPWFPEFENKSINSSSQDKDALLFVVFLRTGVQLGLLKLVLNTSSGMLNCHLNIPQENLKYFVGSEFVNGVEKWFSNATGLKIESFYINERIQQIAEGQESLIASELILTAGPSISTIESYYSYDAASNGWNGNWSKYLTAFEKKFAKYVGVKYALATSSCTGALQIALIALRIGPGDEVIVPDQTWVATANAVRYVGATPVFADIELDSWNIDVCSIEKLITKNTKAIIPVHMYGHPARMTQIVELAKKYDLRIVEDAAPAIGAEWHGKRCGSFGDFAAFSFQGAKLMVTGEGGMLVTNDDELYERALKIWDQGRNPSRTFWIDDYGVKFKMSNIQAAIGLAQLERVDELIEMKRRIFSWYEDGLAQTPHISLNKETEGARSIYWMTSLRLEENASVTRDEMMKKLKACNVDTRPVFPAISQYPIWSRRQDPQPTAMRVGLQGINLPSGVCLSKDQVMYSVAQINRILSDK